MNLSKLYVFTDTPKKFCFSIYYSIIKFPKPITRWVQITPETFELAKKDLPQPQILLHEIKEGIKETGYFIVDFSDYAIMLKYLYSDWEEKWDRHLLLKIEVEKQSWNLSLPKECEKAEKIAMEAFYKWVGLIKSQIKSKEK